MQTVKNIMKQKPVMISPDETLRDASQKMKTTDCGVLPVGTQEKVDGIITDRDIVVRAIAEGDDPATAKVRDYMTKFVCSCGPEDTLEEAVEKMRDNKVSRLVVTDGDDKICGILSFGSILRKQGNTSEMAGIVECISTGREISPDLGGS